MRILALTWTTFDDEKRLMINSRGDLICPAIDGLTNELLNLGHQIVYVNLFAEHQKCTEKELACPAHISGLPMHLWKDIKNKNFNIVWHAIKDPTPAQAIPYVERIMSELDPTIPILNDARKLADHTKRKYIQLLRDKNVGAIILPEDHLSISTDGKIDLKKCHPSSQGAYISKDYYVIRLHTQNSQRVSNFLSSEGGINLRYHRTDLTNTVHPGLRYFFRVPYAAGKCMEGMRYHCPADILAPKSGAAIHREPYSIPDMTAGTISAAMKELGVDIAHVEGVNAGFTVEIFDVNPFAQSAGDSFTPMSRKIAKRLGIQHMTEDYYNNKTMEDYYASKLPVHNVWKTRVIGRSNKKLPQPRLRRRERAGNSKRS
jgi:hypothetical protein